MSVILLSLIVSYSLIPSPCFHPPPAIRAGVVPASEHCIFQIAELVEQEQRVVAVALEMTAIGDPFLVAIGDIIGGRQ
jgi:hypothetical protein